MRFLVAMSLVQTACLLVLVVHVLGEDDRPAAAASDVPVETSAVNVDAPPVAPDAALLRQVIREELAAMKPGAGTGQAREVLVRAPEEVRYQRAYVSDQIDYYSSVGKITANEMHELQREIAALDEAGRREMLSKLTRAMNANLIDGHL